MKKTILLLYFLIASMVFGQVERDATVSTSADVITTMTDTLGNLGNIQTFPFDNLVLDWTGNKNVFRFMVSETGSSDNDGLTWSSAFREIADITSRLPTNLNGNDLYILVSGGTYNPFQLTFNNGNVYILGVGTFVNSADNDYRAWVCNGETSPISSTDIVNIYMDATESGSSISGTSGFQLDYVDLSLSETTTGFAYWDMFRFTCSDATTQGWGTMLTVSSASLNIWGSITIEFPNNAGIKNGIQLRSNVAGFIRGLKVIGKALTTQAGYVGAINNIATLTSIQIRNVASNVGYQVGYKPDTLAGVPAYYDYTDMRYFFTSYNGYDGQGGLVEVNRVKYTNVTKAYVKPEIYLGTTYKGSIIYNSDYLTPIDNSTSAHSIKDTKTGITTQFVGKNISEIGTTTFIKNLPTSAPATSGALWRDSGAGNVIKVVP